MAFTRVHSGHVVGIQGEVVDVEIDITRGLYAFSIVGLADKTTEQARDRVASAIKNSGLVSPKKKSEKVVVSLAPAHTRKEGSGFDLAIAMGYLLASDDVYFNPKDTLFFGELSLDGYIRSTQGILPVVQAAELKGIKRVFCSREDAILASKVVTSIAVFGIKNLQDIVLYMKGQKRLRATPSSAAENDSPRNTETLTLTYEKTAREDVFEGIEGELLAKYALSVAIAGGHHIALIGIPGSGKTVLAERAALLLPDLSHQNQIEVATIYSSHQKIDRSTLFNKKPPFRSPHHSISVAALMGSARNGPGEITLAHKGILYLDELSLINKQTLDALRTPLELGRIELSQGSTHHIMPCDFTLIGTLNPCACGYYGSKIKKCICSAQTITRYKEKINGPLMDRVAIVIRIDGMSKAMSPSSRPYPTLSELHHKKLVTNARSMQRHQENLNGKMPIDAILKRKNINTDAKNTLITMTQNYKMNSRTTTNILRIASTISDMENKNTVTKEMLQMALRLSGRDHNQCY